MKTSQRYTWGKRDATEVGEPLVKVIEQVSESLSYTVHASLYASQCLHGDNWKGFSVIRLIGLQPSCGGGGGVKIKHQVIKNAWGLQAGFYGISNIARLREISTTRS